MEASSSSINHHLFAVVARIAQRFSADIYIYTWNCSKNGLVGLWLSFSLSLWVFFFLPYLRSFVRFCCLLACCSPRLIGGIELCLFKFARSGVSAFAGRGRKFLERWGRGEGGREREGRERLECVMMMMNDGDQVFFFFLNESVLYTITSRDFR